MLMLRPFLLSSCLALTTLSLSACYRVPIPQGNILTSQEISQVSRGMSPTQVTHILGTPVINNTFDNSQLAYVYTFKSNKKPFSVKRVIVYFDHNRVSKVVSDYAKGDATIPAPE